MGIWVSISKHRIGSMFSNFGSWPGLFALAASTCENDWDLFTQKLREHFRGYAAAVTASLANPWLKKVVAARPFNFHTVREVAEFYITPTCFSNQWRKARIQAYSCEVFESLGQTKIVEDTFQRMRHRETTDTRNKTHNAITYWAMARDMGSVELHERSPVEPVPTIFECDVKPMFRKCFSRQLGTPHLYHQLKT